MLRVSTEPPVHRQISPIFDLRLSCPSPDRRPISRVSAQTKLGDHPGLKRNDLPPQMKINVAQTRFQPQVEPQLPRYR